MIPEILFLILSAPAEQNYYLSSFSNNNKTYHSMIKPTKQNDQLIYYFHKLTSILAAFQVLLNTQEIPSQKRQVEKCSHGDGILTEE